MALLDILLGTMVVRRRLMLLVALAAALAPLVPGPAVARTVAHGPSAAQIQAAVRAAQRSTALWATVNVCNTTSHPDSIGVRGQMPSLGFTTQLQMVFHVDYWSMTRKRYVAVPGLSRALSLGKARRGVHQEGFIFTFSPHAGLLRGRVIYRWWMGRKLIGTATKVTLRGHSHADDGDPQGFSSGNCLIP